MPDLLAALGRVMPQGVALAAAPADAGLWPGEDIGTVVPKRLAEFAAGRAAVRVAMQALGHQPVAIPMGADRAPVWPIGLIGTITHCDGLCLAAVARTADWAGIGLDAEPLRPMEAALWPTLLAEGERVKDGTQALSLFVAKEAAYKAQYALTRQLFGFQTLRIHWQGDSFLAEFTEAVAPFAQGHRLSGQMVRNQTHLAAFVAISA